VANRGERVTSIDVEAALREARGIARCAECGAAVDRRERPRSLFCSRACGWRVRDRRRLEENPEKQRAKSRRYYVRNREAVLDRAAAKRGRPRAEQRAACSECGDALEGRRRVVCSERCASARFSRLNPEAVARKVARRRERRRELRAAG
jgi:endogenous inhibitor of DNA gyrase (YacG/DUF329 family)